jgi:chorismate mutase
VSEPSLKAVATVAPPTTDDLHAKIAAVDRRIEELRSERAELAREVARRQLGERLGG